MGPYFRIASLAYWEQVGTNRQLVGSSGASKVWYKPMSPRQTLFSKVFCRKSHIRFLNLVFMLTFHGAWCLSLFAQGQESVHGTQQQIEVVGIEIWGHVRTHRETILREMSLKDGGHYSREELLKHMEEDAEKIQNTRLFYSVFVDEISVSPTESLIWVQVRERWYTFLVPEVSLTRYNFSYWWSTLNRSFRVIDYGLEFRQYNVSGRNDKLEVDVNAGYTPFFSIEYISPYLGRGQKIRWGTESYYGQNRRFAYRTENFRPLYEWSDNFQQWYGNVGFLLDYRPQWYAIHRLRLDYNRIDISHTFYEFNPNYFVNAQRRQRMLVLNYYYSFQKVDNISYPLVGDALLFQARKEGLGWRKDLDIWKARLRVADYRALGGAFFVENTASGFWSYPEEQGYYLRPNLNRKYFFVRGYDRKLIESPRYLLSKHTLKYKALDTHLPLPFGQSAFLRKYAPQLPVRLLPYVFVDAAYAYPYADTPTRLHDEWLYAGGLGMDWVSLYDVTFSAYYYLNSERQTGFSFFLRSNFW